MTRHRTGALAAALTTLGVALAAAPAAPAAVDADHLTPVPRANVKERGRSVPNRLSRELAEIPQASGADLLEGADPAVAPAFYGYSSTDADNPLVAIPPLTAEAHKTEPDKNTYLVLPGQKGADPAYDYGSHFLFQGHESGTPGYITRVNLDADRDHRVTLLATKDTSGADLPPFDGSTWDPFARRLLFTTESSAPDGGVWQATPDVPSHVEDLRGVIGSGGYEGIQADSDGNLWIVEDVGGANGTENPQARQPNSFLYRFVPTDAADLTKGGRLQVLQARSLRSGKPIVFHDGEVDADITSPDTTDLHTYGHSIRTRWVTIHDTATDGTDPFDSNAAAKAAGGTPFKRPENGVFRPGSGFRVFAFTETGDTDLRTQAGSAGGGFGTVQLLEQRSPSANTGRLRLLYQGDPQHAAFDNIAWLTGRTVAVVEDRGDAFHSQGNGVQPTALDSGWAINARFDHSKPSAPAPVRFIAEGRDPSATIDSALSDADTPDFTNDGDNELTGIHVSDGDPTVGGLLGAKQPHPFAGGRRRGARRTDDTAAWRVFFTQQHGDNTTWELVPRP
jgi:hypothetical protein